MSTEEASSPGKPVILLLLQVSWIVAPGLCAITTTTMPTTEDADWTSTQAMEDSYEQVVEDFWHWRLHQSPEFATSLGIHDYDDRLETFTVEAFRHRKEKCEVFLGRIDALDVSVMTSRQSEDLMLLRHDVQTYVDGYRWSRWSTLNPINFLEGIHQDFSFWLDAMQFQEPEDYDKYINRLRALATQINEKINLMSDAVRLHWTNHRISVLPVLDALESLQTQPRQSPFYRPFNDTLRNIGFSEGKIEKYQGEGEAVILDHVLPAFKNLRYFMADVYLPNTRPEIAISSLPGGGEFYADCIKWHLSMDLDPLQLHNIGLYSVEQARNRMDQVRQKAGFVGELNHFLRYTRSNAKFVFTNEKLLLARYREIVYREIPPRLELMFRNITMLPLMVEAMPFDGPDGVTMPPSEDGAMPAIFFVNLHKPHKRPVWKALSLALRETNPGHHFLTSYSLNVSIPRYRRVMEYRKMFTVPFQFPFKSAFTEGWKLYVETLAKDLGLYRTVYDELGLSLSDLLMSCRMVVDTAIHAIGWSHEQSVRYMVNTCSVTRHTAVEEVNKIITQPAQALLYKMGQLKIEELRVRAQTTLGEDFNLKTFHHQVLRMGPVPLNVLEGTVNSWLGGKPPSSTSSQLTHSTFACLGLLVLCAWLCTEFISETVLSSVGFISSGRSDVDPSILNPVLSPVRLSSRTDVDICTLNPDR